MQRWRGGEELGAEAVSRRRTATCSARAMVVNILNPKTAIFFLAFLPQFVDPSMAVAPQVLVLGVEFIAIAVISDGAYALIAGTLGERIREQRAGEPLGG